MKGKAYLSIKQVRTSLLAFSLFSFNVLFSIPTDACDIDKLEAIRKTNEEAKDTILKNHKHYEAFDYYQDYEKCPNEFFKLQIVRSMAKNLVSFQIPESGGWDKTNLHDGFSTKKWAESYGTGTVDNGQSTGQVLFLARVLEQLGPEEENHPLALLLQDSIKKAFVGFFFKMQKENGGFPEVYPYINNDMPYQNYTKVNQDSMVMVLALLRKVSRDFAYSWLGLDIIREAEMRYSLGIDFLLKAQIIKDGKRTGWAQQYIDYTPAKARSYEVPAIASYETAGVVGLLLDEYQREDVKTAVDSAIEWLKEAEIKNVRVVRITKGKIPKECRNV